MENIPLAPACRLELLSERRPVAPFWFPSFFSGAEGSLYNEPPKKEGKEVDLHGGPGNIVVVRQPKSADFVSEIEETRVCLLIRGPAPPTIWWFLYRFFFGGDAVPLK